MSQHTPGPWKVVDGHYPCFIEIEGASFRPAIVTHATDLTLEDTRRRRADAQLMAAAPELLAALKALVPFMEMAFAAEGDTFGVRHNDANDALFAAESAIADAEGRAK